MDFSSINHKIYADTNTDPLSAQEEKELVCRYQKGDLEARRRLIESNLRFVIKMALNFKNQGLSLADLIQEGNVGLIEALSKFDPQKNCRLITYASWWIRLYMQRAVEQKSRQVNLPINKMEILRKIRSFEDLFEKSNGRQPTTDELSEHLGIESQKIEEVKNKAISFSTIHQTTDDHLGMESFLIDDRFPDARETLWQNEATKRLSEAMSILSEREREVLAYRFNLNGGKKRPSLRKVGQILGLSAEGVRRIEEQAMNKLRRPSIKEKIEPLFAM